MSEPPLPFGVLMEVGLCKLFTKGAQMSWCAASTWYFFGLVGDRFLAITPSLLGMSIVLGVRTIMPLVISDFPPSAREEHIRNSNMLHFNGFDINLGPLHKRDWEPMTITLQALSLVEKVERVQVRFILCSRDQRSTWMQDGCKGNLDFYMASNASCFMVTRTIFK